MKKLIIFIVLLAALGGGGWFALKSYNSTKIAVVHPVRGPTVQAVYATGTVEPTVMIPIASRGTGRLMELLADEGKDVKKGEVLARLEDDDLFHALGELQVKADLAQKEYERKETLVKRGVASRESLDQAKADLDAAKAAVEQAKAKLDYMKLTAPEDGRIIRRDGEIGELIPANQPVFWMSCCAPLRVASEVDEEDITLVQPGQDVLIRADAFPGKIFKGKVQSITPKGDPVARSYRVRIGLEDDTPLLIGMTAETNIIIATHDNALLVPTGAVKDGKVWVLGKDGKPEPVEVQTGAKTDKPIEIESGLDDNATVVMDAGKAEEGKRISTTLRTWSAR